MHAALYYLSLVGGFSAPLITKVLRATAYLTAPPRQVSGACSPCTRLVSTEIYRCNTHPVLVRQEQLCCTGNLSQHSAAAVLRRSCGGSSTRAR
jgi:hypothetical protein